MHYHNAVHALVYVRKSLVLCAIAMIIAAIIAKIIDQRLSQYPRPCGCFSVHCRQITSLFLMFSPVSPKQENRAARRNHAWGIIAEYCRCSDVSRRLYAVSRRIQHTTAGGQARQRDGSRRARDHPKKSCRRGSIVVERAAGDSPVLERSGIGFFSFLGRLPRFGRSGVSERSGRRPATLAYLVTPFRAPHPRKSSIPRMYRVSHSRIPDSRRFSTTPDPGVLGVLGGIVGQSARRCIPCVCIH